jgi:ElaB/YqjD/DUF883 family membrane-anchored ribosome-binding protein
MSDSPFTNTDFTPPPGAGGEPSDAEARPFGERLSSKAAKAGTRMADQIGESAGRTVSQAGDALAQGVDAAQTKMQELQTWADDQHEMARERVRSHPTSSIAATFVAGVALGLLIGLTSRR